MKKKEIGACNIFIPHEKFLYITTVLVICIITLKPEQSDVGKEKKVSSNKCWNFEAFKSIFDANYNM